MRALHMASSTKLLARLATQTAHLVTRELTQNGIEHGATRIVWAPVPVDTPIGVVNKICCIDNGVGMSASLMNDILDAGGTSTKSTDGPGGNFGIGARITSLGASPHGTVWRSFHEGLAHEATMRRAPDGAGVFEESEEGTIAFPLTEGHPLGAASGTQVVLLGTSEQDPTAASYRTVGQTLADRYFALPKGVVVEVALDGALTRVIPVGTRLAKVAIASGAVRLKDVTIHYWVLPEGQSWGHSGVLHADEIYTRYGTPAEASARVSALGLGELWSRVVIYAEPHKSTARYGARVDLEPVTERTRLMYGSQELPWAEWMKEFRAVLPKAIRSLRDSKVRKAGIDNSKSTERYYAAQLELFGDDLNIKAALKPTRERKRSGAKRPSSASPAAKAKSTSPQRRPLGSGRGPAKPPVFHWTEAPGPEFAGRFLLYDAGAHEFRLDLTHPFFTEGVDKIYAAYAAASSSPMSRARVLERATGQIENAIAAALINVVRLAGQEKAQELLEGPDVEVMMAASVDWLYVKRNSTSGTG